MYTQIVDIKKNNLSNSIQKFRNSQKSRVYHSLGCLVMYIVYVYGSEPGTQFLFSKYNEPVCILLSILPSCTFSSTILKNNLSLLSAEHILYSTKKKEPLALLIYCLFFIYHSDFSIFSDQAWCQKKKMKKRNQSGRRFREITQKHYIANTQNFRVWLFLLCFHGNLKKEHHRWSARHSGEEKVETGKKEKKKMESRCVATCMSRNFVFLDGFKCSHVFQNLSLVKLSRLMLKYCW